MSEKRLLPKNDRYFFQFVIWADMTSTGKGQQQRRASSFESDAMKSRYMIAARRFLSAIDEKPRAAITAAADPLASVDPLSSADPLSMAAHISRNLRTAWYSKMYSTANSRFIWSTNFVVSSGSSSTCDVVNNTRQDRHEH